MHSLRPLLDVQSWFYTCLKAYLVLATCLYQFVLYHVSPLEDRSLRYGFHMLGTKFVISLRPYERMDLLP